MPRDIQCEKKANKNRFSLHVNNIFGSDGVLLRVVPRYTNSEVTCKKMSVHDSSPNQINFVPWGTPFTAHTPTIQELCHSNTHHAVSFQRWRKRRGAKTGNKSLMPGPGNGKQFNLPTIHHGYHPWDCKYKLNGTCGTCSRFHIKAGRAIIGKESSFCQNCLQSQKAK